MMVTDVCQCHDCLTFRELVHAANEGQSRMQSLIETLTNLVVGLTIAFFLQPVIYAYYGLSITHQGSLVIALTFTGVSLIRGYIIRRFFNSLS